MKSPYQILFRKSLSEELEYENCSKYFEITEYRSAAKENAIIIGRYSVLPFYNELEKELRLRNSRLINSFYQHKYIADVINWADTELKGLTPKTWTEWSNLPDNKSFIVKGRTNSRKSQWATHMFCESKKDVPSVAMKLLDDTLIGEQGIVVREYERLNIFGYSPINGMPISNEWRTFWLVQGNKVHLLCYGYYWSNYPEYAKIASIKNGLEVAERAAINLKDKANFFVLDIAEKENGEWIVIEVNDGQMSGLSSIDSNLLYSKMLEVLSQGD